MLPKEIEKLLVNVPSAIEPKKILELSISHIKGISLEAQNTLKKTLDVKTIADFATKILSYSNVHLLKLLNIKEDDLERWQTMANYITRFLQGKVEMSVKVKILLSGLDNAGKSAILSILTKRFNNIAHLKPTVEVNIEQVPMADASNISFVIWDMGGQEQYRAKYIENPERYFIDVKSVIFVIDIQDKANAETSKNYLIKILDILESFAQYPDFFIFLHKADPQIYDKIQNDLKAMEDQMKQIFTNRSFQYHILHTSIYNTILTGTNFAESLTCLFGFTQKEGSSDLLNIIQRVYDSFIGFSYAVEEKLQKLESKINDLESKNRQLCDVIPSCSSKPEEVVAKLGSILKEEKPPISPYEALNKEIRQLLVQVKIPSGKEKK
jgi:GTPase SAR1 family protein